MLGSISFIEQIKYIFYENIPAFSSILFSSSFSRPPRSHRGDPTKFCSFELRSSSFCISVYSLSSPSHYPTHPLHLSPHNRMFWADVYFWWRIVNHRQAFLLIFYCRISGEGFFLTEEKLSVINKKLKEFSHSEAEKQEIFAVSLSLISHSFYVSVFSSPPTLSCIF